MKRLAAVVGFTVALLVARGGGQAVYAIADLPDCLVTICGTENGEVVDSCMPSEEIDPESPGDVGGGGQAMLDPGVCKTLQGKMPCDQIPECLLIFATRETPALGNLALLMTALTLGGAGMVRLRPRLRRS